MPKKTTTRLQGYKDYFANHRWLSRLIMAGIIVTTVAGFTEKLSNLLQFASNHIRPKPEEMVITLRLQNSRREIVEVQQVCDFEVFEAVRNATTTYIGPGESLRLSPYSSTSTADTFKLKPAEERDYRVRLPTNQLCRDLSARGAASIKFVVWLTDGRSATGSMDFQKESFRRKKALVTFQP